MILGSLTNPDVQLILLQQVSYLPVMAREGPWFISG